MVFKKWWRNTALVLKNRNLLLEEFFGPLAYDSRHDSKVILSFSLFESRDFYEKIYYKRNVCSLSFAFRQLQPHV